MRAEVDSFSPKLPITFHHADEGCGTITELIFRIRVLWHSSSVMVEGFENTGQTQAPGQMKSRIREQEFPTDQAQGVAAQ